MTTIANVSRTNARGLPPTWRAAQEGIHFPDVQYRLRRLSVHPLGLFMPHLHDERTGPLCRSPLTWRRSNPDWK